MANHEPVDKVVAVEGYEQRQPVVAVGIHSAVVRYDATFSIIESVEIKHRFVRSGIEINILTQTTIEAICRYSNSLAHY